MMSAQPLGDSDNGTPGLNSRNQVGEGVPDGGKIPDLAGMASAFTPEYAPEEMFEIAKKLYAKSR